jgi:uncharacterized protein
MKRNNDTAPRENWRPPRDSWFSPKIEVRASDAHGLGTFARERIEPGEIVEIWGEFTKGVQTVAYTSDREFADAARRKGKAVMQWDDALFSVEERGADDGYFINHSCDSNLWFADPFTLIARREIEPGDEVTIDYALFESNDDFVAVADCKCGAAGCRHRVTGADWRRGDLQERYRGHFSPLLNHRIERAQETG